MNRKDTYPKNKKPPYSELLAYFPKDIRCLFNRFDSEINDRFKVYKRRQRYDKTAGWVYGYCRNDRFELPAVTVQDGCFNVLDGPVSDEESLFGAFERAEKAYAGGFEAGYEAISAKRRTDQTGRTKKCVECEKKQTTY